jgi:hypothetical protein
MPIIDTTYFVASINIPNADKPDVSEQLEFLIEERETELLTKLLGLEMYVAFTEGLKEPTVEDRWLQLKDGYSYTDSNNIKRKWRGLTYEVGPASKSLIANYVYYWYSRNNATITSGAGEVVDKTDNAARVSPAIKQATAWNEMVDSIYDLIWFLQDHSSVYPEWKQDYNYYGYCSPVGMLTTRGYLVVPVEWQKMNLFNL